ncbi:MAG: diphthine synthase [Desulfurococcaceae archaeon]
MLVFIGLGYSTRHLTLEALEELKTADIVFVDTYTSMYEDPLAEIESFNPQAKYVYASRRDLEGDSMRRVVEEAKGRKVVIAVPGDPFIATTHDALLSEATKQGVEVKIVNGISFITMAYSRLGLQSYRFGKHVTLVYPTSFKPYSTLEAIYGNLQRNLHTIVLLDLRVDELKFMTISEAVDILLYLDEGGILEKQLSLGVARLGWKDEKICVGSLVDIKGYAYPPPPHSVVILAKPSPVEGDIIEHWKKKCH